MPISSDAVISCDPDFTAAYLDGKVILLSLRADAYFNFNEVGTQIWEMLARPCRAGEIFRGLLRHYEVDEKTLVVHVATFWEQLAKDRLVKLVDVG